jgi:hypothetical protein
MRGRGPTGKFAGTIRSRTALGHLRHERAHEHYICY